MAKKYSQTSTSNETTNWIRMDSAGHSGKDFFIVVDMESQGDTTACVDVHFTAEEDLSNPTPVLHHILNDITESTASTLHIPVTAFRMDVLGFKKGTVTLRIVQHQG